MNARQKWLAGISPAAKVKLAHRASNPRRAYLGGEEQRKADDAADNAMYEAEEARIRRERS